MSTPEPDPLPPGIRFLRLIYWATWAIVVATPGMMLWCSHEGRSLSRTATVAALVAMAGQALFYLIFKKSQPQLSRMSAWLMVFFIIYIVIAGCLLGPITA